MSASMSSTFCPSLAAASAVLAVTTVLPSPAAADTNAIHGVSAPGPVAIVPSG